MQLTVLKYAKQILLTNEKQTFKVLQSQVSMIKQVKLALINSIKKKSKSSTHMKTI